MCTSKCRHQHEREAGVICNTLKSQAQNFDIQIKSPQEQQFRKGHPSEEDYTKNLFKIMCGVLNLRLRQRGHNLIENKLLQNYLKSFSSDKQNIETMLINQMHAIKSLVNRKAFSISDV